MSGNRATLTDGEYFSTLLRNLPGMAYRFANDGHWTMEYVSEGARELTGWRPGELVGHRERTIFKLAHPDDIERGYAAVKEALAERRAYQLTYRLITRDGRTKWVWEQGQGVFDGGDKPVAVEGFITDITEHKEAQLALKQSERRFRSIFENAIFGIYQSTPDGRFLIMNPASAAILGYDSPEEAIQGINDIATDMYVDPQERARFLDAIHREGQVPDWISRVRRRDGSVIWVTERSRGVFGAKGELRYIEGTVRDITEEMATRAVLRDIEVRASELRAQLADARLRALRLQLNPHFLFNVLNTISMMVRIGATDKAQRMISLLGEMFRFILEFEDEQTITFAQELKFVDLYLTLQKFRFENRLAIRRRIDDAVLPLKVPTLILQPIIENAVTHGITDAPGPYQVDVTARRDGCTLIIEIDNDAGSRDEDKPDGHGIGLPNTRRRLRELYGEKAVLTLEQSGGRVRTRLTLPFLEAESNER